MSRRNTNQKSNNVDVAAPIGVTTLITATAEFILNPHKIVLSGTAAGALTAEFKSNGVTFLSMAAGTNATETVDLGCYELAQSSGLTVTVAGAAARVSVFYTLVDETPGLTKIASRATSYQASKGAKAVRAPSIRGVGEES